MQLVKRINLLTSLLSLSEDEEEEEDDDDDDDDDDEDDEEDDDDDDEEDELDFCVRKWHSYCKTRIQTCKNLLLIVVVFLWVCVFVLPSGLFP